jgi:nucleoside-diphosphate-sugar epimerase
MGLIGAELLHDIIGVQLAPLHWRTSIMPNWDHETDFLVASSAGGGMRKPKVALFGASGTMGHQAFKELWTRREEYDIVILVLPSEQKLGLFRKYEQAAGVPTIEGSGVAEGDGLKIVWGDAANHADVEETDKGVEWVPVAMAYISPQADYHPEIARAVNTDAIVNIVKAIEAQPGGADRIKFIYTGTVAETGNRPEGIHVGRVGDPLKPSVFDFYAVTKIAGERAVLESEIKHWASLRMTFIMPTNYKELLTLQDPILFHMPIDAYLENLTDRDAGYGLVNCLDIPDDSDFWRRVYNMGGGPEMRCRAFDYANKNYQVVGMSGVEACTERNWFALRNFHMQYYEDSHLLNEYLHYWRTSLDEYWQEIAKDLPFNLKVVAFLSRLLPFFRKRVEKSTYTVMKDMAENHKNGTAHWYQNRNDQRISAFYKDYETYESIPGWRMNMPDLDPNPEWRRLDHGYDESKSRLELSDLQGAAEFRGGKYLSGEWDGDMFATLDWKCAAMHEFQSKANTILKAGHWCPECIAPPWDFDRQAKSNPFFAQVWYADHDQEEQNFFSAESIHDILNADHEWARRAKS